MNGPTSPMTSTKPASRTSGPSFSRFWQTSDNRTQSYNRVYSILLKIPCFRNPVFHNHTSASAPLVYSPLSTFYDASSPHPESKSYFRVESLFDVMWTKRRKCLSFNTEHSLENRQT